MKRGYELFNILMNAESEEEFIQILRDNRIPEEETEETEDI